MDVNVSSLKCTETPCQLLFKTFNSSGAKLHLKPANVLARNTVCISTATFLEAR